MENVFEDTYKIIRYYRYMVDDDRTRNIGMALARRHCSYIFDINTTYYIYKYGYNNKDG